MFDVLDNFYATRKRVNSDYRQLSVTDAAKLAVSTPVSPGRRLHSQSYLAKQGTAAKTALPKHG